MVDKDLLFGAILALVIAGLAYKFKALNRSGAAAAFLLGTIVFGFGGLAWALILIAFFVSSSGLSVLFKKRKEEVEEKYSKGTRRDAGQVLANGGIAGIAVLLYLVYPDSLFPWVTFCAAFAAANADTWATELGVLSKTLPRSMRTWKPVTHGTSGGVSLTGTLAALAGSLLIAFLSYLLWNKAGITSDNSLFLSGGILVAGVGGSLIDSYLGATIQAIFWCQTCEKETEKTPAHTCGSTTILLRGWKWLNNDWVNLACTASAAVFGLAISLLIQ